MIIFVIAMDSEAQPFIDNMKVESEQSAFGRRVILGDISGKPCGIVVCGVGKVNAAAGAQYAIDILHADKIVNVGVAGGLNVGTKVGEIYGISHVVQYDFDLTSLNGTPMGTLNEYEEPYLECEVCPLFPTKKLATGDRFNDSKADFELLTGELKADVRDMEGGAVAHVCKHAGMPFYSIKAISDVAGAGATTEQFLQNLKLCTENLKKRATEIFEAING